jgi:hypothetical protein
MSFLRTSTVAISISESADLAALGLSKTHLQDAMTEIARYLLAQGARLVYGGDLRAHGFTKLLFELVARHRENAPTRDDETGVVNYLAWPVHIAYTADYLQKFASDLAGSAELICLRPDGTPMPLTERLQMAPTTPTAAQFASGLTAMREAMRDESAARIVLGGAVEGFKGSMPGIAEEALLSLQARQPLYVLGGFGGCAGDVARILGLPSPASVPARNWSGSEKLANFRGADLNNGLTPEENAAMAGTPHVDQAVTLLLRGLRNVSLTVAAGVARS